MLGKQLNTPTYRERETKTTVSTKNIWFYFFRLVNAPFAINGVWRKNRHRWWCWWWCDDFSGSYGMAKYKCCPALVYALHLWKLLQNILSTNYIKWLQERENEQKKRQQESMEWRAQKLTKTVWRVEKAIVMFQSNTWRVSNVPLSREKPCRKRVNNRQNFLIWNCKRRKERGSSEKEGKTCVLWRGINGLLMCSGNKKALLLDVSLHHFNITCKRT